MPNKIGKEKTMLKRETVEHIVFTLELAQKQRELGVNVPPFFTQAEHQLVLAYWRMYLESVILEESKSHLT